MGGLRFVRLQAGIFKGVDLEFKEINIDQTLRVYAWRGSHPRSHYVEHFITVSEKIEPVFEKATHEVRVSVRFLGGAIGAIERLLYSEELNLNLDDRGVLSKTPEQLCCALAIYLLKTADPKLIPGIIGIVPSCSFSPWGLVVKQTLKRIRQEHDEKVFA